MLECLWRKIAKCRVVLPAVFLVLAAIGTGALAVEAPEVEWEKKFASTRTEFGTCVKQTRDGGYIIAAQRWTDGDTQLLFSGDIWLIKTDSRGNRVWDKSFSGYETARVGWDRSVHQTTDGGYIVVGTTLTGDEMSADIYLVKTDARGNRAWEKTFDREGRVLDGADQGSSGQQTTDSGYVITGGTYTFEEGSDGFWVASSDVWLIKTDSQGNKLWGRTFGETYWESGISVQQTNDGGYIILGVRAQDGLCFEHVFLIKTNAQGNKVWEKEIFSGDGTSTVFAYSMQQTADGGYIITGEKETKGTSIKDVFLIKTDAQGNRLWKRVFSNGVGLSLSVQQTRDGGYIIAGGTDAGIYLLKTNAQGNKVWEKIVTGSGAAVPWAWSVQQTVDGGYIITGGEAEDAYSEDVDVFLIKLKPEEAALSAAFTYSPQDPVVDRWVTFDASASSPRDRITSYAWNFGDSELVKYGLQVRHSYSKAGLHTVLLTVSDGSEEVTATLTVPVSLYGGEYILPAPSDPPSLEYAHFNEAERTEIYHLVARVLTVARANTKIKEKRENVDHLFNRLDILLNQIHPEWHDPDLREKDLIKEGTLSENEELLIDVLGGLAGAGIRFLTGVPAPLLGTGLKMLSFYLVDRWYLSDLATATVLYPAFGRMEIIWFRPPQNKILVRAWLEEPFNQSIFITIPLEERPRRTAFGLYECPVWWCGLTCPAEYALKELTPRLRDVEITWLDSPGELVVRDIHGNVTGCVDGATKAQILDSAYDPDVNTAVVFYPKGEYTYEVMGTESGLYTLGVSSIRDSGDAITFTATEIGTASGTQHRYSINWDSLAHGAEGVTLEIDADGDGIPERTVTSDTDLVGRDIGVIPIGQVVNLGPNPVSAGGCVFWFNLPEDVVQVKLMLLNVSGRPVFETLINTGATHFPSVGTWNPVDQNGSPLANGPYVYILIADGKIIGQGKMVIQR